MICFGVRGRKKFGLLDKNDVWTLDLTTYAWTELVTTGTKLSARNYHSSILYNGKMVIFGGFDNSEKNDTWTLDFPSIVHDNKMMVYGGYTGSNNLMKNIRIAS